MTWCQIVENWTWGTDFQGLNLWNLAKLLFGSFQFNFSSMPIIFPKKEIWQSYLDLGISTSSISSISGIALSLPEESIFPWFIWDPLAILYFFQAWQLVAFYHEESEDKEFVLRMQKRREWVYVSLAHESIPIGIVIIYIRLGFG